MDPKLLSKLTGLAERVAARRLPLKTAVELAMALGVSEEQARKIMMSAARGRKSVSTAYFSSSLRDFFVEASDPLQGASVRSVLSPKELTSRIVDYVHVLTKRLAVLMYRRKLGKGNTDALERTIERLRAVQKNAAVAGQILGMIAPWIPRIRPVPTTADTHGDKMPKIPMSVLTCTDQVWIKMSDEPSWLLKAIYDINDLVRTGKMAEDRARDTILSLYRFANLPVPQDIILPAPPPPGLDRLIKTQTSGPAIQAEVVLPTDPAALTAEVRVSNFYSMLDRSAQWLAEKNLTDMDYFRRVAANTALDPGMDIDALMQNLSTKVEDAAAEGITPDEFEKRVASLVAAPSYQIETLLRTQTKRSYDAGLQKTLENPKVRDALPYVLYLATHDGRVRHDHLDLSDKCYALDDPESMDWINEKLAEFNCRCTLAPVTEDEATKRGIWRITNGDIVQVSDDA